MLQRAASNAYSWWWASHIRTKQSKWLDSNLQDMEDVVKQMLKLIETDADSFARRAELYFKRRPELISFVENFYRAYRALADRYDHISGELHKANHTIATAFPERVQYAMLEEEDSSPKAITPIDPTKINKRTVEGLMNKKKETSTKKGRKKSTGSAIDKKKAQEDINKLQKGILVLRTEKQFLKSSYESGIAKYWDIEKHIMEMQEEVYCLQDQLSTRGSTIEDEEARDLMTATVLKSCEDTIVNVQEQRKKAWEQAKAESERTKVVKEKLKALKGESCQSEVKNTEMSDENAEMSFTAESMEEEEYSLNKARTKLQSICEKIKEYFEVNPENSVIEIEEKIEELANKVITLKLAVSSQAEKVNQLTSGNSELEKYLQSMEEEKIILNNDSDELSKRINEAEEELGRVQAIERIFQDEEIDFCDNFTDVWSSLNDISEKLQPQKPLENCTGDASPKEDVSTFRTEPKGECEDKQVTEIHDIKDDLVQEIHTTQELGHCLPDPSQTEAGSQLKSPSEKIEDPKEGNTLGKNVSSKPDLSNLTINEEIVLEGKEDTLNLQQSISSGLESKEKILLSEYTLLLQNYNETKRRLSEVEKKNEDYLRETMALIGELKNDITMKDEEIRLLRQQSASASVRGSPNGNLDAPVEDSCDVQPSASASVKGSSNDTLDAPSVEDSCHGQPSASESVKGSSDGSLDAPSVEQSCHGQQKPESTANSATDTQNSKPRSSKAAKDLNVKFAAKRYNSVEFSEIRHPLAEGINAQRINEPKSISPIEEKFKRQIDTLLEERLGFWLKFSTSFHHIQQFKAKYEDLQTDINKLKDNKKQDCTDIATGDQAGKPESAQLTTRLRELKTEVQVWLEQGALLRGELQSKLSTLCDMEEEISNVVNTKSESGEALFNPYQAASLQGEVINMKQENNKLENELQMGLDQVRGLQAEIEEQLSNLYDNFDPFGSKSCANDYLEHLPGRASVPLRDFLFGVKPKKTSLLARIQYSKLRAGRRKLD